jgi:hypothetical protein
MLLKKSSHSFDGRMLFYVVTFIHLDTTYPNAKYSPLSVRVPYLYSTSFQICVLHLCRFHTHHEKGIYDDDKHDRICYH